MWRSAVKKLKVLRQCGHCRVFVNRDSFGVESEPFVDLGVAIVRLTTDGYGVAMDGSSFSLGGVVMHVNVFLINLGLSEAYGVTRTCGTGLRAGVAMTKFALRGVVCSISLGYFR